MNEVGIKSEWLDEGLYPFRSNYLDVGTGAMHYVDEGEGPPVLFVHGTPSWSFLWRNLIQGLREGHRCVAPDHLGYGLSDKPTDPAVLGVKAHAERLIRLIEELDLRDVTLVVHDFGGPIGLACALRQPERISRVVVMNSWLWSNAGNKEVETASRLLGGPVGRFLYTRLNFSARFLLRNAFADKSRLSQRVHGHYLAPFATVEERLAPWVLAGELTAANDWYAELWRQRDRLPRELLLVWGMADRLMPTAHLTRWQQAFPHARTVPLEGVGHFVPEEAPAETLAAIREFMEAGRAAPPRAVAAS